MGVLGVQIETIISPVLAIVDLAFAPPQVVPNALILTSEEGAVRSGGFNRGLTAWCVGQRTAAAARRMGYLVHQAPDVAALLPLITGEGPFLYIRGRHITTDLAAQMRVGGASVEESLRYDQVIAPLSAAAKDVLAGGAPVLLPLYSVRSATAIADLGPFSAPLHVLAISEKVAQAAAPLSPLSLQIARRPDGSAMVEAIASAARRLLVAGGLA